MYSVFVSQLSTGESKCTVMYYVWFMHSTGILHVYEESPTKEWKNGSALMFYSALLFKIDL